MTESDSLTATAFRVLIAVRRFTNQIFRKCCMIKTGPVQSFVIFLSFVFQILLGSSIYSLIFDCYFFFALFPPFSSRISVFLSSSFPLLFLSFIHLSFLLSTLTTDMAIQQKRGTLIHQTVKIYLLAIRTFTDSYFVF